jgi:hypothetical protein
MLHAKVVPPIVRSGVELCDGRAASCPESRLRVLWVVEAGLPPPLVNVPVFTLSGLLIGIPDLIDAEADGSPIWPRLAITRTLMPARDRRSPTCWVGRRPRNMRAARAGETTTTASVVV